MQGPVVQKMDSALHWIVILLTQKDIKAVTPGLLNSQEMKSELENAKL